ncbi:MAG TPA: hypothetical protein DCP71_16270 [Verrucomicrobiales bacterium]|nr:hypothetical protein [Verrucomicrobiales bacterium]
MKPASEKSKRGPIRWSWVIAGVLLVVLGAALLATLVLAPVGIGMMVIGAAVIAGGVIRPKRRRSRHKPWPVPPSNRR